MSASKPTTKPKVSFHDPNEFLDELRTDRDKIDRHLVRLTGRRRYPPPFVAISVVASAVIEERAAVLAQRLGEVFCRLASVSNSPGNSSCPR